ncbi:MAG: primosomal protein N' [Prevotellaceae bacterium]|jgi:primosomal protein N' (replication factor Y)|nr:primosomal protein N' [Prevotellaceae bacterium]
MLVNVILPFPLKSKFTYYVPTELQSQISVGQLVIINFGVKKFFTGIVFDVFEGEVTENLKPIVYVIDTKPIVSKNHLEFWEKLSEYYCCPIGDVFRAAIPSVLRLDSETVVIFNTDFEDEIPLSDKEFAIYNILQNNNSLNINKLNSICGFNAFPTLKKLSEKNLVSFNEEVKQKYREKTVNVIVPNFDINNAKHIEKIIVSLKKTKKQAQVFEKLLDIFISDNQSELENIDFQGRTNCSSAIINALAAKNILKIEKRILSKLASNNKVESTKQLTEIQQNTLTKIEQLFENQKTVLLHGVTSSGKTEIYIQLILKELAKNKNILYLVPEIGLTSHLVERLQGIFGEKLLVYHSQIADSKRAEIFKELNKTTDNKVVVGTRSSVFLPFNNLGLVVIDEEHDNSYKQTEHSPRYNAKTAAAFLAQIFDAKILLGGATPSIEAYSKAKFGKFGLAELSQRYSGVKLPDTQLVDIAEAYRKKRMTGHFSLELIDKIKETLSKKEQVILFQNRRGYSLSLECQECGWVQKCKRCDVSLTYHRFTNTLSCHYCGYTAGNYGVCQKCKSKSLSNKGFGTEQVEQEATKLFPDAKIGRLDLDTTRKKGSFQRIINTFEQQYSDIMIGTTMISKGLDFSNVGLVGVINADNLMNFPNFRAYENAYQTLVQVSGRAGRKEHGNVFIQTYSPENPLIINVLKNDYQSFFKMQMAERNLFYYPPYCRLIQITIKHKDSILTNTAAINLAEILKKNPFFDVLGPDNPPIEKIKYLHLKRILLKINNKHSYLDINKSLVEDIENFRQNTDYKNINVIIDVEPT